MARSFAKDMLYINRRCFLIKFRKTSHPEVRYFKYPVTYSHSSMIYVRIRLYLLLSNRYAPECAFPIKRDDKFWYFYEYKTSFIGFAVYYRVLNGQTQCARKKRDIYRQGETEFGWWKIGKKNNFPVVARRNMYECLA